jgi:hypothetical protein
MPGAWSDKGNPSSCRDRTATENCKQPRRIISHNGNTRGKQRVVKWEKDGGRWVGTRVSVPPRHGRTQEDQDEACVYVG